MDDPVGDGRSAESFDFMDSWPEVQGEVAPADDCDPDCAERSECTRVGELGHSDCGTCETCGQPRHHCGLRHPVEFPTASNPCPDCPPAAVWDRIWAAAAPSTPAGERGAIARLLLDAEREWSLLPVEQMPKAESLAESKALHLADVVLSTRPPVPTQVDRPRWDDDLVALRAGVKRLIDNQQSWIDHGRSGQVISRDAVRDTLRTLLADSEPSDSSPESR